MYIGDYYMKILGKILSSKLINKCTGYIPKSEHFNKLFHKSFNNINREIGSEPILFTDLERMLTQEIQGIKFKKAKTIDEAKEYAKSILGIKKYEINDLEIANQFNLSTTRAFNKTRCHDIIPDEVDIGYINKYVSMPTEELKATPATTLFLKSGQQKLRLNKTYIENIDTRLKKSLEKWNKFGQISKNTNGINQINLACNYRYKHSLNRYYKLYQEGKLTTKAKIDFDNLLTIASTEETSLLYRKKSVTDIINKYLGIDLSKLSANQYEIEARKALINMQTKHKIGLSTGRQSKAVGLDNIILHEEGHVWHNKTLGTEAINQKSFTNNNEADVIYLQITPYASKNPKEMVAECFSGMLSGEKYSDEICNIFKKYAGKMLDYST